MKVLRLLFLCAAIGVAAFVAWDYWSSNRTLGAGSAELPRRITSDINSQSGRWTWEQSSGEAARVTVSAAGFRQGGHDAAIELSGVELHIFHSDDETFDRVQSASAIFDVSRNLFVSEGDVTITLGVPAEQPDSADPSLTRIYTSQARFDTKAGSAEADNPTRYEFDGGQGSSLGSRYDSSSRIFHMKAQAYIEHFPTTLGGAATRIRAGQLYYHESDDRVDLFNGASLERGTQRIEATRATVRLSGGKVRNVDASDATGSDIQGERQLRFRTPQLEARYSDLELIESVTGVGSSELISETASAVTRATGDRFDLHYKPDAAGRESLLDQARVRGHGVIRVEPRATDPSAESRHIASEDIRLEMQPDGRNLRLIETLEPGSMELASVGAGGSRRRLEAERIKVVYASGNRMEGLTATGNVFVRRTPPDPKTPALLTWSDALEAGFEPATSDLIEFRQWGRFRFEQGERRGSSNEAVYQPAGERIELSAQSRIEDPGGSVQAHRIVIDQLAQTLFAQGGVSSVYRDSASQQETSTLFTPDKPVYATGSEMESDQNNGIVVYRGQARLWQDSNRVEADLIRIDRPSKTLQAEGSVFTLLRESQAPEAAAQAASEVLSLVEVRASKLRYSDSDRLASYSGGVVLKRKRLVVRSQELDAQLSDPQSEQQSRLETAEARGDVRIVESAAGRRGFSDWAWFDAAAERLTLRGSPARAANLGGEETRGAELTYQINDDSLLVSGGDERAYTYRRRQR